MLSRCVHLTARKSPYTGARGADYKSDEKSSGSCARGTRANCSVSPFPPPSPRRAYNDGARGVVAEERNAVQLQASGGPPRWRYRSCRRCCRLTSDDLSGIWWFSASRQRSRATLYARLDERAACQRADRQTTRPSPTPLADSRVTTHPGGRIVNEKPDGVRDPPNPRSATE
jgi:hypothetical protein